MSDVKGPVRSSGFNNPQEWKETKMGVERPEVLCLKNEETKTSL